MHILSLLNVLYSGGVAISPIPVTDDEAMELLNNALTKMFCAVKLAPTTAPFFRTIYRPHKNTPYSDCQTEEVHPQSKEFNSSDQWST
jgi:hypothetical protein